jgi:hypothetical protein
MTKAHSKLGASASERWMNCPGSIRMSEGIPSTTSDFAKEGTVAHEVAEILLREFKKVPKEISGIEVTDEMVEHCQTYVDYVWSRIESGEGALTEIEQKFHLAELHPQFFGTADCVIYKPDEKRLIVIDFKYGRGIPVEVKNNPQLRYYALGAAMRKHNYGVNVVEMVIVQPRCPHPDGPIRSEEISAMELVDWSADLVAAARRTAEPDAPLNPGDWCKFCPAQATCPAREKQALEQAQADFADDGTLYLSNPDTLPLKALWDKLAYVDQIEDWCRSVRTMAHHEAEAGRCDPRYKLVATRPTSKFKDNEIAEEWLIEQGCDKDELYTAPELKTPAQCRQVLRQAVGISDAKAKKLIAEIVETKSSGTVLAPIDDPRPRVQPDASEAFTAFD